MDGSSQHRFAPLAGLALLLSMSLLVACGSPQPTVAVPAQPTQATARVGDVTIRASLVPTESLDAGVASRHGIARESGTVLLLVGVRRGEGAAETSLPAAVQASVTDLRGRTRPVALRELRSDAGPGESLLDYAGTVEVSPPDTLRFEIAVDWDGEGRSTTMQLQRDFTRP
jgi:hypothetical protein